MQRERFYVMRTVCNKKITNITATRKSAYEKLLQVAKSHNVPRKWKILKCIEKNDKSKHATGKTWQNTNRCISNQMCLKIVHLLEKLSRGHHYQLINKFAHELYHEKYYLRKIVSCVDIMGIFETLHADMIF